MDLETTVLLDGLAFPTRPRWHDGRLWFSDDGIGRVMTVDLDGNAETVVEMERSPGGLGWLPDGRLLVVSMRDRRLLRLDPGGLVEVADLSDLASGAINTMLTDRQGRAYICGIGFDPWGKWETDKLGEIVLVTPDGDARVVAGEITAIEMVITPDGGTLIVAEAFMDRLTAFNIQPDGSLTGQRIWAQLEEGVWPHGLSLDAEGAVWTNDSAKGRAIRVREGGEVTHQVQLAPMDDVDWRDIINCVLGGPDRRTLFVLGTSQGFRRETAREKRTGRIEIVRVDVPGAGLP